MNVPINTTEAVSGSVFRTSSDRFPRQAIIVFPLLGFYLFLACFWQGIQFFDESEYLNNGTHVKFTYLYRQIATAPLYAVWFKLLSFVVHDAVWRYLISWGILVVIASCLPLLFRISNAWAYSLVLLVIPFFSIWPYVSLFGAIFVILGFCIVVSCNCSLESALAVACCVCFVVTFARPEYCYGTFIASGALFLYLAVSRRITSRRSSFVILSAVVTLAVTMLIVVKQSDSSRSGLAFSQHFNRRAFERGQLDGENYWTSTYAQRQFFKGNITSPSTSERTIGDYYRANPQLFRSHLFRNIRDPRTICLILLVGLSSAWPWLSRRNVNMRPASIYIFFISLPVLAAEILIYPRNHYAVIIIPSLLLLVLQLFRPDRWITRHSAFTVVATGIILIAATTLGNTISDSDRIRETRSNVQLVRCLQAFEPAIQANNDLFFDSINVENVYFSKVWRRQTQTEIPDWGSFQIWTRERRPRWLLLTPELENEYHVTHNQMLVFLQKGLDYNPHICPYRSGSVVYVAP